MGDHGLRIEAASSYIRSLGERNDSGMDSLIDFWGEVEQVWQGAVFGTGVGKVLIGLGVLLLAVLARGVFTRLVLGTLGRLTRRTSSQVDDSLLEVLRQPLRFVFVILGLYLAARIVPFPAEVDLFLTRLVRSLIAFTILSSTLSSTTLLTN